MKTYYAIKNDDKYFCGWNVKSIRTRSDGHGVYVWEEKNLASEKIKRECYITQGTKESKFWQNAKIVKLPIREM